MRRAARPTGQEPPSDTRLLSQLSFPALVPIPEGPEIQLNKIDQGAVFVGLLIQCVQFSNRFVKCLKQRAFSKEVTGSLELV